MPLRPIDKQLLEAIGNSNVSGVRQALDAGADPNATWGDTATALFQVVLSMWPNSEIFQLLLQRGADISRRHQGLALPEYIAKNLFFYPKLSTTSGSSGYRSGAGVANFQYIDRKFSNPEMVKIIGILKPDLGARWQAEEQQKESERQAAIARQQAEAARLAEIARQNAVAQQQAAIAKQQAETATHLEAARQAEIARQAAIAQQQAALAKQAALAEEITRLQQSEIVGRAELARQFEIAGLEQTEMAARIDMMRQAESTRKQAELALQQELIAKYRALSEAEIENKLEEVLHGNIAELRRLLDFKIIDANYRQKGPPEYSATLLHLIISRTLNPEMVRLCLMHGADPRLQSHMYPPLGVLHISVGVDSSSNPLFRDHPKYKSAYRIDRMLMQGLEEDDEYMRREAAERQSNEYVYQKLCKEYEDEQKERIVQQQMGYARIEREVAEQMRVTGPYQYQQQRSDYRIQQRRQLDNGLSIQYRRQKPIRQEDWPISPAVLAERTPYWLEADRKAFEWQESEKQREIARRQWIEKQAERMRNTLQSQYAAPLSNDEEYARAYIEGGFSTISELMFDSFQKVRDRIQKRR